MAFRQSTYNLARFNSATSSEFLSYYQNCILQRIVDDKQKRPSNTMSPSSFRCDRFCWFRVRDVEVDTVTNPDPVLQFKADVGTGCHKIIQETLIDYLKDDWINIEEHIKINPLPWDCTISVEGNEYRIEIPIIQFRMACDGIVRWNDKLYLLEIKTVEYAALEELTDPMPKHMDQVKCYATMLNLNGVLFLYQDRTYGGLKCYEVAVTQKDKDTIINKIKMIIDMKDQNVAPDRLPSGDMMCSGCEYKAKCKQYG